MSHLQADIGRRDHAALRHQDGAFHGVVQFAHVAGPWVFKQKLHRCLLEAVDVFAVSRGVIPQKVIG